MSRPRKSMPARQKSEPRKSPRKPLPEDLARDAIAHEESLPGDKVRMTFRVVLPRQHAEALATWAIREEKNIGTVVTGILEDAVRKARR